MCLIVFALDARDDFRLVLAGNRDEFHARPAQPLAWRSANGRPLLAGQDLEAGGTWLGISPSGRFGAITNFREPKPAPADAPSRGELITSYVCGTGSTSEFLRLLAQTAGEFAPYNLLFGDLANSKLQYFSNRAQAPQTISPGVHGLSNHLLNTPWPKTVRTTQALSAAISGPDEPADEALFRLLADRNGAEDCELPDTGISIDRERVLASPFIITDGYGTRCSSLITVTRDNVCRFVERSFDSHGQVTGQRQEQFEIESGTGALV